MAKPIAWSATVDGQERQIKFEQGRNSQLWIDGSSYPVKPNLTSAFTGLDVPFTLNGREARLIKGLTNKMDLVIDGTYLSTGKPYRSLPGWVWIFIVICFSLVVYGGALGALAGILGGSLCCRVAKSAYPAPLRVLGCLLVCGLTWLALLVVALFLALVLY